MTASKDHNESAPKPGDKEKSGNLPPAGPHADPRLMNPDATPGSGAIAPIGETDEPNIQPTS
jgi:hypothetical protein